MAKCIYGSDICKLNPDPTDLQRAIWRRHHKAGTSPGDPKWYRRATLPTMPKSWAGQKPKYPVIESGAEWLKKNRTGESAPDPFHHARSKDTTAAYVAAYDVAAGLKAAT